MNEIKRFFKELKRVRWPKTSEVKKTYLRVIIFVLIFAIVLFGLYIGLTAMWDAIGVGLNGK